jgi:hypothetical protein
MSLIKYSQRWKAISIYSLFAKLGQPSTSSLFLSLMSRRVTKGLRVLLAEKIVLTICRCLYILEDLTSIYKGSDVKRRNELWRQLTSTLWLWFISQIGVLFQIRSAGQ